MVLGFQSISGKQINKFMSSRFIRILGFQLNFRIYEFWVQSIFDLGFKEGSVGERLRGEGF
jgi:hypothetical protein